MASVGLRPVAVGQAGPRLVAVGLRPVAPLAAAANPAAAHDQPATSATGWSGGCTATYTIVNEWPGGFQGEIRVTAGSSPISGWQVTWTFNEGQRIDNVWNATVVNSSGSMVTATNVAHNGSLPAGGSTTFGFLGTWNGSNNVPNVTCTAS